LPKRGLSACSRMGARARVGLAAWGAGRVRYQGRLPPD